jgi:glyoxalase family protein
MTIETKTMTPEEETAKAVSSGLHHVTAITRDGRANLRFYTQVLGLRLVKRTVNFDDPTAHHLYYGDGTGAPGTILTFFAWEGAHPGQLGLGQAVEIAFRVPRASLGYWTQRLIDKGVAFDAPEKRFGETVLGFKDPDGIRLEIIASGEDAPVAAWTGPVPAEHAVRGFHAVTLWLGDATPTADVLTTVFGYRAVGSEGNRSRFSAAGDGLASIVDIRAVPGFLRGRMGTGTVHHIAFRAANDEAQAAMSRTLSEKGLVPTEQKDRNYFRSVYVREPGGVIFEIATDDPGFAADESLETLGTVLKLPAQFEPFRAQIEAALPPLD